MNHTTQESESGDRLRRLQTQIRQLILLRETGPKSARWHAERARLIWRLQEEVKRAEAAEAHERS
jgi:hypothetical protein